MVTCDIVIPARYAAARLPGKLLLPVAGKPLLQHTWERAKKCQNVLNVYIATGDQAIADAAERFGAEVLFTRGDHDCGTSRIAEAYAQIGKRDLIVNVQGDEPEMIPGDVDLLIGEMLSPRSRWEVGTLCSAELCNNPSRSVVKVARGMDGRALYFSRDLTAGVFRHIGVYAYRPAALMALREITMAGGPTPLAAAENLEQLFYLEHGWNFLVSYAGGSWSAGIDTPDDYEKFKARMESVRDSAD